MADSAATTLRILADASQVTSAFKKVDGEWKAVADKATKNTGGMMKMLEGVPKSLFSIAAAVAAVGEASRIALAVGDKQAGWARDKNNQNLTESAAIMRAGGNSKDQANFLRTKHGEITTRAQRDTFLKSIGEIQEDRRSRFLPALTQQQLSEVEGAYLTAGDQGFGENGSELTESIKSNPFTYRMMMGRRLAQRAGQKYTGQGLQSLAEGVRAGFSRSTALGLAQQGLTERTAIMQRQAANGEGQAQLAGQEGFNQWAVDHPYRAELLNVLPGFLKDPVKASIRGSAAGDSGKLVKEMRDGILKLAHRSGPALPNLNTRGEGAK